jgi:ABC-type Mn2+/Zn2+ transport system permease subunit
LVDAARRAVGTTVGLCVPVAGVVYAFACFLLPALVARNTCREIGSMFAVAPIVSVGCAVVAFVVARRLEVPPAALTVVLQAFLLLPAWLLRRVRP